MEVFILLFSILVVLYLATINHQNTTKGRRKQAVFCTILLVCIQGLRHASIGIDSANAYRPYFESVDGGFANLLNVVDLAHGFEPGFVFYTKLVKTLIDNTQVFIFISSLISIVPISYIIYKYAENIPFAFIIFAGFIIYHFGFSGIRQAMAVGITAIAFDCMVRKKLLWFIVIVVLAATIHTSAIMFLIAYPLYHYLHLSPARMLIVGIFFILFILNMRSIVVGLTGFIFGGERYMHKASELAIASYNLMFLLAVLLIFTFTSKDARIVPFRSMLLLATVFQSLGLISTTASRMAYYYMPYLSIALPMTTGTFKNKIIVELLIIAFFISFFFYCNSNGYLEVVPYKFFWE